MTEIYKNRLLQKLDERIALKLELRYTKEGTSEVYAENYFADDTKDEKEIRSTLSAILYKHRSILIIGKPGAGKTTTLLDLAITFLEQAKEDEFLPYPVILDLSSWQMGKEFSAWIEDVLINGYGFNKKFAHKVIDEHKLSPFLDGLDEISDINLRDDCLKKLGEFRAKYEPDKLVICSRIDEYKDTIIDAPVKAEVLVKDLTQEQIEKVLQDAAKGQKNERRIFANSIAAKNILTLKKRSPAFREIIRIPFYFNLSAQIFDSPLQDLGIPLQEEALRLYLIKAFIEKKLAHTTAQFRSSSSNEHYLAWLAENLRIDGIFRNFELSTFQAHHLRRPRLYSLLSALSGGAVFGLFNLVIFSLVFDLKSGLLLGAFVGIITAIFGGGIEGLTTDYKKTIETQDVREWHLANLLSFMAWMRILGSTIISGLLLGVTIGLAGGWYFGDLTFGISFAVIFTSFHGFFTGLFNEAVKTSLFAKIQSPYQRIRSDLGFFLIKSSLSCSVAVIFYGIVFKFETLAIVYFALFSLLVSALMAFGSSTLWSHFILRICFYLEGTMPLRYVNFLNYATSLRILEHQGGQWRFRHKILQDHFASLYRK